MSNFAKFAKYDSAMRLAIYQAKVFVGATAPNPPVGAAVLDEMGNILSVKAHEKAGSPHAEVLAIDDCVSRGLQPKMHTLVVTLEPCNISGKTPPCTDKIKTSGIKRVVYGIKDPNPKVSGKGAAILKANRIETIEQESLSAECKELIRPFSKWIKTGLPWVTVKQALDQKGSMIPPEGQKTFTSPASLRFAHELRKRADAILTGSGTILADNPLFTVRHVIDHPGKKRFLVYMDRRGRVTHEWVKQEEALGFLVMKGTSLKDVLQTLGKNKVLEVLVEAGPSLTSAVLSGPLWDSHVVIKSGNDGRDLIEIRTKE